MKKLIIAAAVACVSAFTHAAAIDWSASNVVDPWTTATAGKLTPANAWKGYVILDAVYETVVADLAKGNTKSLTDNAVGSVKTSTNKGAFNTGTASGSVAGGSQNFHLIVFNNGDISKATYFYAGEKFSATVDASLDTTIAFGSVKTGTQSASNWTAISTPEPTSGLLLLFGMAGLALKRKRC